jgi:phosphoribosylaminoimidazole (AIR) synthetase
MPTAQVFIDNIEAAIKDAKVNHPHIQFWINELRDIVDEQMPKMASMCVGSVYTFTAKKKAVRAILTKENTKTWVLYEVDGSDRPGCRWMLGKSWCSSDNIQRDTVQSYSLPESARIK